MNGDWNIVNSEALHTKAAKGILLISPFLYIFLQYILIAPYGKHSASSPKWNWGPKINAKLAWFLLELPNLFWIFYAYWNRNEDAFASSANGLLLSLFVIHYINRCIVYPFRISAKSNPVNLSIISAGFLFCLMNGWLQTMQYCVFHAYPENYHKSPTFITGTIIWFTGFIINLQSDGILRTLRNTPPTNIYKIPKGGFFRYVSGANFFGEIVEWAGYAIASQSLAGLAFLVWVCTNLIPRANAHHQWYLAKLEDYPKERWAVIPFIL